MIPRNFDAGMWSLIPVGSGNNPVVSDNLNLNLMEFPENPEESTERMSKSCMSRLHLRIYL